MSGPVKNISKAEITLMAVALVLMILLSPISYIWAALDSPWYFPYLAWMVTIFISWLLQQYLQRTRQN